MKKLYCCP